MNPGSALGILLSPGAGAGVPFVKHWRSKMKFLSPTGLAPFLILALAALCLTATAADYPVIDTGQKKTYSDTTQIAFPDQGQSFAGQDAQYAATLPVYSDNGDGTVTDLQTGLMWQKAVPNKLSWTDAMSAAATFNLAGHTDWRLPSIKELYSLIRFNGWTGMTEASSRPYMDDSVFDFLYGDTSSGERFIDAQWCSSTEYVGTTMGGDPTIFGVNFADGRIKGYPKTSPNGTKLFYVRYVRGNTLYGVNDFVDNGDGTITDRATGLIWMKVDSGAFNVGPYSDGTLNWEQALDWAENLAYAGRDDWRLPDAKELQSIVDYTRAPTVTYTAAIDVNYFDVTEMESYFWASTTHCDGPASTYGTWGAYVAFGRAMGYMEMPPNSGQYQYIDVHGAGAQRGDPKSGDPNDPQWQYGHGPQGDEVRIYNYARCVCGKVDDSLSPDARTITASTGTTITFALDAGASHAGQAYLLLASDAGAAPGTLLPGGLVTLPLARDWFTDFVLARLNTPLFSGFYGALDGSGQATAQLKAPALSSAMAEMEFTFAFATMNPFDFASRAVSVEIE
jgi:hypothetical protein